jgi:hypothetical protein
MVTFKSWNPAPQKSVRQIKSAHWINVAARAVDIGFVRRERVTSAKRLSPYGSIFRFRSTISISKPATSASLWCNRRQRSGKDNGPEPVATIPQCRCQRRGDLRWRAREKRPDCVKHRLMNRRRAQFGNLTRSPLLPSQRSFGKTFWKTFECAKNRDERIRALQTTARERISRECP